MSQAEDVVHGRICACRAMRTQSTTHVLEDNGQYEVHAQSSCKRAVRIDRFGDTSFDIQLESVRGLEIPVMLINGIAYERAQPTQRMHWVIEPMGKVRMTQSDKWKKGPKMRPVVRRYWAYHDRLRELGVTVENGDEVHFHIQMPKSWSKSKKALHDGTPCLSKPDTDNLVGGLVDAVHENDAHIWWYRDTSKRWTSKPSSIIIIRRV